MRKENRQSLITYSITVIVAFTVGLYFGAFSNPFAIAAPQAATPLVETKQLTQSEPLFSLPLSAAVQLPLSPPQVPPVLEKATPAAANPIDKPEIKVPEQAPAAKTNQEITPPPVVLTYETTADYLNVRVSAHNKSDIINVVEKGTVLEVSSVTENGWLQLKDGGFVHGGYAKPIKTEEITAAPLQKADKEVKTLSAKEVKVKTLSVETKVNEPTSKVESISGLTAEHIATILKGTDLEDQGLEEAILQIEDEYGINAFFTIAVMKLESGNGSSKLARKKNNLFGLNATSGDAYNKGLSFKTKADCVLKFGELIASKYIEKGYTTIEKVAKKYCPANSKWPSHVKDIMERDQDLL
ncbi:SH3 domain-containing protein [Paenibacillus cellulosilyticus]|uniref:SH3 domain-containing protein n=1 Tax=Paenibacillus cellulosilyticus TaxID=375489 RepID=A0A2V2YEI5_9BACL|nr:glucosaminidase domain-containing protein [Paenibacillus cellulosilyticus]PWV91000.1 SH3 domain-containing protein [Paenibacillus cellulosilyticus]QKS45213.1 glucosaminidase domain-containing protein [Paenibacillus cellulosilyticus]